MAELSSLSSLFSSTSSTLGYWEPSTATLDWCEPNYAVTIFVAEFWNTVSSLAISVVGAVSLLLCFQFHLERRFFVLQMLVITIGLGSALFHGTLRFGMQMGDEIPMVWAILSWYYLLFQLHSPHREGSPLLRTALGVYAVLVALVHYLGAYTTAFQVHFVFLVTLGFVRVYVVRKRRESAEFNYMTRLYFYVFLIAAACWLVDKFLCAALNAWLPFNPQFHAWWHLLMAFNVHFCTQYSTALRLKVLDHDPKTIYIMSLPFIVPSGIDKII